MPALPKTSPPAQRALASIGVHDLAGLTTHTEAEVAALHGMGPKALRSLAEALAAAGLAFRGAGELPDDVRVYVDGVAPAVRPLFDRLHHLILEELPTARVVISYSIPLYKVGKRHVGLHARADGVTLTTTSPDHIAAFRAAHPAYKTNKASIRFPLDTDLPLDDVRAMVRRAVQP